MFIISLGIAAVALLIKPVFFYAAWSRPFFVFPLYGWITMIVLSMAAAGFTLTTQSQREIQSGLIVTAFLTPVFLFVVMFWKNLGNEIIRVGVIDFTPTRAAVVAMLRAVGGGMLVWLLLPLTAGSLLADRYNTPFRYVVFGWPLSLILGFLLFIERGSLWFANSPLFGLSRTLMFGVIWVIVIIGPGIGGLLINRVTS